MEYQFSSAPMPQFMECSLKHFGHLEYHCTRHLTHYVLIFMLHNSLSFSENGAVKFLKEGEWYLQEKGTFQEAALPCTGAEYYYLHFDAEPASNVFQAIRLPKEGTFSPDEFLPHLVYLDKCSKSIPCNHLETYRQFLKILNFLCESTAVQDSLAIQIMRFLNENYATRITSAQLAAALNFSAEHIEKTLKSQIGVTPHTYLTQLRLNRAKVLLERGSLPVSEIAANSGFGDVSVFFRAFRKKYGCSPSQWRQRHSALPGSIPSSPSL